MLKKFNKNVWGWKPISKTLLASTIKFWAISKILKACTIVIGVSTIVLGAITFEIRLISNVLDSNEPRHIC